MATKYPTMNWEVTNTAEAFKIFKQQNNTDRQMPSASARFDSSYTLGRRGTGVPRQQDARPPKPTFLPIPELKIYCSDKQYCPVDRGVFEAHTTDLYTFESSTSQVEEKTSRQQGEST